jgi:hypothetical protein
MTVNSKPAETPKSAGLKRKETQTSETISLETAEETAVTTADVATMSTTSTTTEPDRMVVVLKEVNQR